MTLLFVQDSGEFREASQQDVLARAHELLTARFRKGTYVLKNPSSTHDFLRVHLGALDHEVFGVLYLNVQHRLIGVQDLFRGTIDTTAVYPREIVRGALEYNAAGLICYHNHPSGSLVPSPADELITRQVKDALAIIDVRLVDHLVIGDGVYSFAQHGLL